MLFLVTMVAEPGWSLSLADCESLSTLLNFVSLGFLIYKAQRANGHSGFLWVGKQRKARAEGVARLVVFARHARSPGFHQALVNQVIPASSGARQGDKKGGLRK